MIPDLALIVSVYTFTRLLALLVRKDPTVGGVFVKISAVLAMLVTFVMAIDILLSGARGIVPQIPPGL